MADWKNIVKTIAPTVASALGGPLAGAAVTAVGELFGIDTPTQDKIKDFISSGSLTGEQISRLKELELQYKNEELERNFRYAELEARFQELEVRDREAARARDANLANAGIKNHRADVMFVLAVVLICVLVYLVWRDGNINEYVKGVITLVLGRFLGYLDNIYNFEFGTTRGSERKTEILAKAQPIKE